MRYTEFGSVTLKDIHKKKLKQQREDQAEIERHILMPLMYGGKERQLDQLERELDVLERLDKLGLGDGYDRDHIQKMAKRYLSKI